MLRHRAGRIAYLLIWLPVFVTASVMASPAGQTGIPGRAATMFALLERYHIRTPADAHTIVKPDLVKRDYPLPGMVTTMGTVCNCCCAGGAGRYYALAEDHVAAIPLHLNPSKKASGFYSHAPIGPIQPAVEVRRSANLLYTLVKVPICESTPEQNALLQKGEELLVEDVRLFSIISFTRLELTARGFNLIRRQVASVPDEFRAEWDQAELLEEP